MLRWDFKEDRLGTVYEECVFGDGHKEVCPLTLYNGNGDGCYVILDEDEEHYTVFSFFLDNNHAKNSLGISKEFKARGNIFDGHWQKVVLYNTKEGMNLAKILMSAKWNNAFTVEIVPNGTQLVPNYHK